MVEQHSELRRHKVYNTNKSQTRKWGKRRNWRPALIQMHLHSALCCVVSFEWRCFLFFSFLSRRSFEKEVTGFNLPPEHVWTALALRAVIHSLYLDRMRCLEWLVPSVTAGRCDGAAGSWFLADVETVLGVVLAKRWGRGETASLHSRACWRILSNLFHNCNQTSKCQE